MKNFRFDELDYEFLLSVQALLEPIFGKDQAPCVLENSSLFERLRENPEYVYHYDEAYWAAVVQNEYQARSNKPCTQ